MEQREVQYIGNRILLDRAWDEAHDRYRCRDWTYLDVPQKTVRARRAGEPKAVYKNLVVYARDGGSCVF